jgi:hypothetical protein
LQLSRTVFCILKMLLHIYLHLLVVFASHRLQNVQHFQKKARQNQFLRVVHYILLLQSGNFNV